MLMKATKFCKQKCYFLPIFCPANHHTLTDTICKRHQGCTLQTESIIELVVNNSTNKIFVFEKGKYCFHGPESSSS